MTWSVEVETSVSASRLFKAAILDWHNLGPKVAPEIIVSGTGVEGEGGVGSVRELKFTSVMPFTYIKERLDFVDHEKFECKATIVEGGHLGTKLESASVHFKIEPTASGGSVVKVETTSKVLAGVDVKDDIEKAKESVVKHFKATEAYLVANPTAYA